MYRLQLVRDAPPKWMTETYLRIVLVRDGVFFYKFFAVVVVDTRSTSYCYKYIMYTSFLTRICFHLQQ